MISIIWFVVRTSGEIWTCALINFCCSRCYVLLLWSSPVLSLPLSSVLQVTMCYWFGIDLGVICCHLIENSLAKLLDIRTAGDVTFVNVLNHIFNKTADAHHKSHFPSLSDCVKSASRKALTWAEIPGVVRLTSAGRCFLGSWILWQCWKQKDSCKKPTLQIRFLL